MAKKSPRPDGLKISDGITVVCAECAATKKLKNWRADLQEKMDSGSYLCYSCNQSGDRARGIAKLIKQPDYWSPERRKKQSERNSGKNNPMYGVDWRTLVDSEVIETHRLKCRLASLGENNPMHGVDWRTLSDSETILGQKDKIKAWANSPEGKATCAKGGLASSSRPTRKTNPEKAVEEWLRSNNLAYSYSKRLGGRQFDFAVGNTLIEVHGDYWHANPEIYGPGKRPINETQEHKVALDKIKSQIARENGYRLVVIWEKEINAGDYSALEHLK